MNRYSEEYAVPESVRYPETSPYPESIKERVDEDRYPGDECDMIVMLMRVLMYMIPVLMIVMMPGQELFHEIDDEKPGHESVYRELARFERFGQYMYERNGEHRTSSEGYEEIQYRRVDLAEKIEDDTGRRDEKEHNQGEE